MNTSSVMRAGATPWWRSSAGVLLLAALLSSAWAWWLIAAPVITLGNLPRHAGHFPLLYVHALGGTTMLFLGAFNLYIGSTRRFSKYHRLVGTAYLVAGCIGVAVAIAITSSPAHKTNPAVTFTNTTVSLLTLSAAWLAAAAMAWRAVRNKRYDSHRDWMFRSYVLVWAFVFCRLASRVPEVNDLGGGQAFIWLAWVGPLLVGELALQWRAGSAVAPTSSRQRRPA